MAQPTGSKMGRYSGAASGGLALLICIMAGARCTTVLYCRDRICPRSCLATELRVFRLLSIQCQASIEGANVAKQTHGLDIARSERARPLQPFIRMAKRPRSSVSAASPSRSLTTVIRFARATTTTAA